MKYAIGDILNIAGLKVTIVNAFIDFASRDPKDSSTIPFYSIIVEPDEYWTVINEHSLELHKLNYYTPTISGGFATNGNVIQAERNSKNPIYHLWQGMIYNCYNTSSKNYIYQLYGACGVTVCDKWRCYEYFLIDFYRINGCYEFIRDKYNQMKYVVDFNEDIINNVPLNQRQYNLNTVSIRRFKNSFFMNDKVQVSNNTFLQNRQKAINNSNVATNSFNQQSTLASQPVQNTSNSIYTREDYERVINDPSFMDKYPKPGSPGTHCRMINPSHGNLTPVSTPREPDMKTMCVIVPPGTTRPKYQNNTEE